MGDNWQDLLGYFCHQVIPVLTQLVAVLSGRSDMCGIETTRLAAVGNSALQDDSESLRATTEAD